MPTRRALLTGIGTLAATGVLAACGTTQPAVTDPTPAAAGSTGAPSGPVTVTDAAGRNITLERPATRVVTLEWGQTEDVISLGLQPVGVADIKGYGSWNTAAPITGSPIDVGTRGEPSVEAIARANPDLILGIKDSVPANVLTQLEEFAPVVQLTGADATRPIDLLKQNCLDTGALLGKGEDAKKLIADLDAAVETGKKALASAAPKVVFAYIYATGNTVELRMHSDRSQPMSLTKLMGITNAYTDPGDDGWGLGTYSLEQLSTLPADTQILYWVNKDTPDPVSGTLATNPVWQALPAVKAKKVFPVADGIWIYGGPASSIQWVNQVVEVLG